MGNSVDYVKDRFYVPGFYPFGKQAPNPQDAKQAQTEQMYIRVLTEMSANAFEWEGLPKNKACSVRYLELTLFNKGHALFFKDADTGWRILNAIPTSMLNEMGDYTHFTPVGVTKSFMPVEVFGEGDPLPDDVTTVGVPIWSNYLRMPDWDIVLLYAARLAFIDSTLDINVKSARRTRIMAYNENQALTAANVQRQIDRGESVIGVSPAFNALEVFKSLDLGVDPKSLGELHLYKTRLWNECMGMLGINNSNQDKKERLVADEVAANDNQIEALRRVRLNERRTAARAISELTGETVTVNYFKSDEEKAAEKRTQEKHDLAMREGNDDVDSDVEDKPPIQE